MYKIYADGQLFCSSKAEETAVLSPKVRLEGNKAGTFTFIVPPAHPYYDLIQRRKTLIDVYRDDDTEPLFEGICVDTKDDFFKQRTIECEGELTFFNDSFQRPHQYTGQTARQILEAYVNVHNSRVEAMKRFTVGQVTVEDPNSYISCFTNYNSTMEEIKEDLIDDLGGYLRTRHVNGTRYIDYLKESPRTCEQVIELGVNLLDLSKNVSAEQIATVIIPLGATIEGQQQEGLDVRVGIASTPADSMHPANADYVYSAEAVERFGWIEKVVEWDEVTDPANLLAKAKKYLQETQYENLVIEAQAIDLGLTSEDVQKFKLLDNIRVISRPHGLDRYFLLSKMEINLNNPENDTITLGVSKTLSMSAKTHADNEEIKRRIEIMPTSNEVKSAIDNATALITGVEGGYVVIERNDDGQPIEIRIQDALNNPTKIWRWNQNGFGYSNDGGNTYGTAITMNGAIVADFIKAGTMSANLIKAGTMLADRIKGGVLTLGGNNNGNGLLEVKNASNQLVGKWDKDGIKLYQGKIGGWTFNDYYIEGFNNSNYDNSTCYAEMGAWNPQWGATGYAFSVWVRSNTSESYNLKWGVDYNGNSFSRSDYNAWVIRTDYVYTQMLFCSSTKNRIVETEHFGYKTQNAYETPTPYFGDIGEGKTDANGECYIAIDEIFKETVDLSCKYQVFLQEYGEGKLYVAERKESYFVVKGTPNLEFGYELKAIQGGQAGIRFPNLDEEVIRHMEEAKEIKHDNQFN